MADLCGVETDVGFVFCASLLRTSLIKSVGDLMSVKVLGQPIVIIQSSKVAIDMLDKRSATYSDRPVLTMGSQLVGWNKTLALTPYGARFREYR